MKGEWGSVSDFITFDRGLMTIDISCKDLSNAATSNLESQVLIPLSVQDSVPFEEISLMQEFQRDRGSYVDYHQSKFIASSNPDAPLVGMVTELDVADEVGYKWSFISKSVLVFPKAEEHTFVPNSFIKEFWFYNYKIKLESVFSNIKILVPYRVKLDLSQLIFTFHPNTNFEGDFKCTMMGNMSYHVLNEHGEKMSTENTWAPFFTCKNHFCRQYIHSLFTRGTIHDFNDLRQLHLSKATFYVQCKDLSTENPHPDINIQFPVNFYLDES
ncbi:hypothetical protein HMI56_005182 [Coelomomyces lativittatus]|nr:hypothetical protein HMI56_005182 [Coelomomyces lativittatus]